MRKTIIAIASLFAAASVSAGWQLVEDGEGANNWFGFDGGNFDAGDPPVSELVTDPTNSGQGKVVRLHPGTSSGGGLAHQHLLPLPDGLEIPVASFGGNDVHTYYYKMLHAADTVTNTTFGMVTLEDGKENYSWGIYKTLIRDSNSNGGMQAHTGGDYVNFINSSGLSSVPQDGVWYEYWIVIDRVTDTWDGYIKGGQWTEQTQVVDGSGYRDTSNGVINGFLAMTQNVDNTSGGQDANYFDDIYVSLNRSEANLSSPTAGSGSGEARLINISTRGRVGTADNVLIGGFVITGSEPMTVLIQGVGPELVPLGIDQADVLTDPQMLLVVPGGNVSNDDWESDNAEAKSAAMSDSGATMLVEDSKSAAILTTLDPGLYTVIISGVSNAEGIALVEVYEVP